MNIKTAITCALAAISIATFAQQGARRRKPDGERPRRHAAAGENAGERQRRAPEGGERQRPQIDDETRQLIAAYRRDPTEANKAALRKKVEANYDKMIEHRKSRLNESKGAGRDEAKTKMMQERLEDMQKNRESHIDRMMSRFTNAEGRPGRKNKDPSARPRRGKKAKDAESSDSATN